MKIFGERLKELRTERGISQAALAKLIGVSCGIICLWEIDKSEPTAPNILKIAEYFDISTDYLLGRTDGY